MKSEKPKVKPIKMLAKDIMSFEFTNLMQKLINTPTENSRASHIHKVYREIERNAKKIRESFKPEILDIYAQKDDKGEVIYGEQGTYEPIKEKLEEYHKAMEAFEAKEVSVEWRPLTPDSLADVKLTAKEIEILGPLFVEQNGPGVPHLKSMSDVHPN